MKRFTVQLLIFLLGIYSAFGQNERKRANYWNFGNKAALDFSCLPPHSYSGSQLVSGEGSASISDLNGNLLMYTNGVTVWDANNNVMPNGTGLNGSASTVQAAIIIPNPTNPNIYYIFYGGTSIESHGQVGVSYSEVDMSLNGGMGDVTSNKNIFLFKPNEEKLTAVANATGNGYWVVAQKYDSNEWYAYEVTGAGVNMTPVISTTGPIARFENSLDAKLSPDGTMLATQNQCNSNASPSVCLYSFDNASGSLNFLWEDCGEAGFSTEFSPDCSKLYIATNQGIKQYDLTAGANINDATAIIASKTQILSSPPGAGGIALQLANDCKIYVSVGGLSSGANVLNVIENPNLPGTTCNYQTNVTPLVSGNCQTRLTNFVSSFFYNGCPDLDFNLDVTDANCEADGAIDLTITNGTAPFHYDWSNGDTTQDISELNGGWYSVVVTDEYGNCMKDSAYVTQNQQTVAVTETITQPSACGTTDGAIDLDITPIGGASVPIVSEDFETDGEGSRYSTVGLQDPGGMWSFFKRGTTSDFDFFSGSPTGEHGTHYFGVNHPNTTPVSLTMNPATITGYYNLQLCIMLASVGNVNASDYYKIEYQVDGGGWVTLASFYPTNFPYKLAEDTDGDGVGDGTQLTSAFQDFCYPIPATGNQIEIRVEANSSSTTSGFAFDYIRLTGNPPLTYTVAWSPDGETTDDINNKGPGTYDVQITTSTGCVVNGSYTLIDPCSCTAPVLTINPIQACAPNNVDLNDGIDASSDPANATFYNSQTDANNASNPISNTVTSSGSYWVRAEDPNDPTCFNAYEIQVTVSTVTYTANNTNPTCGNTDGEIDLTPNGGNPNYTYSIDNGVTTQASGNFPNLGVGNYTIVITDANGCQASGTENLSNSAGPVIDSTHTTDPSCSNNDGGAEVFVSGGNPNYTYQWLDASSNPIGTNASTIAGLAAGTYSVEVTDVNGCSVTGNVTLNPPAAADNASFSVSDFCEGATNNATITGTTGGTFTIVSPTGTGATIDGTTGEIANGVGGTTYTIEYTTNGTCPATQSHDVNVLASPTYTVVPTNPSCGNNDGQLVITPDAGFTITDYSIDNGATTQSNGTFSNLSVGNYTIVITDANGCQASGTENLSNATGPTINAVTPTDASCNADDGTISVTATGANPLNYSLDNGQTSTTGNFLNLADGNYVVTVTDGNGCVSTQAVSVGKTAGPTLTLSDSTDVSCFGANDGSAVVQVSGGSTPYTYNWSPSGGTSDTATGLSPGTYTATVTDGGGCSADVNVTINEPDSLSIHASITPADCGQKNGSIDLTVTGGAGNYTYVWTPNVSTTNSASDLAIGNYDVTVTDANGCSKTVTYSVNLGGSFYIDAHPDSATILQGESVDIHLSIDPNVAVDSIVWSPSEGLSCTDCTDLNAQPKNSTTYIVTVTDTNGCVSTDTVAITVILPCADIFVPNTFSPNVDGVNDFECVMGDCITTLDFSIYNRWGEMVFHSSNQKICWDGKYKSQFVQTGVYVYKLRAVLKNGKVVEKSGNITVVR